MMPLGETLGFWAEQLEAGSAVVSMDVDKRHANVLGVTHGGLSFVLADTAIGLAFLGFLADGEVGITVEMKINFLRPVWCTRLRAEARTVHHGRRLSMMECDVRNAGGHLVARATATMMRLTEDTAKGRENSYQVGQ